MGTRSGSSVPRLQRLTSWLCLGDSHSTEKADSSHNTRHISTMAKATTTERKAQPAEPTEPELDLHIFQTLPYEIRGLIWEATLPPARIFHVRDTVYVGDRGASQNEDDIPEKSFVFYIKHPPPSATSICRESRQVAFRNGGFFFPPASSSSSSVSSPPGPWFNPNRDILYFDRNQRHSLRSKAGRPVMHIQGWDRVLNVGLEWRALFSDVPRPAPGQDMRRYWKAVIRPLYLYMPHMTEIHYILPRVRHKGGVTWGREPYGAFSYPPELEMLPEATGIPWEKARGLAGAVALTAPAAAAAVIPPTTAQVLSADSRSRFLTTWKCIREDIERSFDLQPVEELQPEEEAEYDWEEEYMRLGEAGCKQGGQDSVSPPRIVGWWLLRCGAPKEYEDPRIRAFFT